MALGNLTLMRIVRNALSGVYSIGFRWWFEPLPTRQTEHMLKGEIRRNLSFLFDNVGAKFVPNEREHRWPNVGPSSPLYLRMNRPPQSS